ncbi:MAG: thermonuclease family protein [Candidatus Hydrogenedentota bacterium]
MVVIMEYLVEVYDRNGLRAGRFDRVPLMEAARTAPGEPDVIEGLLPKDVIALGPGYRVVVTVEDEPFCEAAVTWVGPEWSDTKKLILDRYVPFHEVIAFRAEREDADRNTRVRCGYASERLDAIVKDVVSAAEGPVHYLVTHETYPDGATREYQKYLGRKMPANELETAGIASGQWVETPRINANAAYAKDGDTIAGLVVDGVAWPDLRLMMIDSEERSKNSHAVKRHPEIAAWTAERYAASGYALAAEASRAALQALIDTKGIDAIELNPHRGYDGEYDDRVDAYGRYIGLVYGAGECFNAAMVELGQADVYLYKDGKYHVPEMRLKEYFSYRGTCENSINPVATTLTAFEADHGVFDLLTALAYAGGCVWSIDSMGAVHFHKVDQCDHVIFYDPVYVGVLLSADGGGVVNAIYFEGNPILGPVEKTYVRSTSADTFGYRAKSFRHFGIAHQDDADLLVHGLLDDLAYPEAAGIITVHHGCNGIRVGELIEVRGAPVRRLDPALEDEWGGRFEDRIVRRVKGVTHRFSGYAVSTTLDITSPLRSVKNPLHCMTQRQGTETSLYQFRLDDALVGFDSGYHLD